MKFTVMSDESLAPTAQMRYFGERKAGDNSRAFMSCIK
jgi:hypothetical protein